MQDQWEDAYPGILGKIMKNVTLAGGRDPEQGSYSALYASLSPEIVSKDWNGVYLSDPVCRLFTLHRSIPGIWLFKLIEFNRQLSVKNLLKGRI